MSIDIAELDLLPAVAAAPTTDDLAELGLMWCWITCWHTCWITDHIQI